MKHGADRILTTRVGSLPRPKDLLDLMKAKVTGLAYVINPIAKSSYPAIRLLQHSHHPRQGHGLKNLLIRNRDVPPHVPALRVDPDFLGRAGAHQ